MPHFFTPFPNVGFDIHKNGSVAQPVNIMLSFKIRQIIQDRLAIYYNYDIKEGDRPDIIADKYYGDTTLDWVILMTNQVLNPIFDWPLDYDNFVKFVKAKYINYNTASTQVHHYNKILHQQLISFDGIITPKETVEIDLTTYNATAAADREIIYALDYEEQLNNDKRKIHILDEQHIPTILGQVQGIF